MHLLLIYLAYYWNIYFLLEGSKYSKKHGVEEYNGEIMIAIVFVGIQKNLLTKIEILRNRFI